MSENKRTKTTRRSPIVPEEPIAPDWINTLNDDCLVRIFKYLPLHERLAIETVCKRWKEVAKLAWNDIKILNLGYSIGPEDSPIFRSISGYQGIQCAGNIIIRCGRYLKELKLGYSYNASLFPIIGQHCENLTDLGMEFFGYSQCLPSMPKLTCLKMKMLLYPFPEDFFQTLPHETLTELHLWGSEMSPRLPDGFLSVLKNLQKLKALTLQALSLTSGMIEVIGQMSTLTYLSIAALSFDAEMRHLDLLTNLEHLKVHGLEIKDDFLIQISGNNKNLKYLSLAGNSRVSNKGLTDLQELFQLEELIVNHIPEITDQPLGKMHNLRKLECEGCRGVKDEGIIKLLEYAPNLEYLKLVGSNVSAKVLIEANEVTKRRTNDLRLEVVVTPEVNNLWDGDDDYSPLLDVSIFERLDESEDEEDYGDYDRRNPSDIEDDNDNEDGE